MSRVRDVLRGRVDAWIVLATLAVLVLVAIPALGSDPWPFRTGPADPRGILGPLVRAAAGEWDVALLRTAAVLAGVVVALGVLVAVARPRWAGGTALAVALAVVVLLTAPGVLLQAGLRDATEPWFHTNDSTFQIEIAGDLVLDGRNPYGHDYRGSGLERFYSRDGSVTQETLDSEVALRHFAYFPGTPLVAAAWRVLPAPLDDFRLLVLLATVACLLAFLAFDAPLVARLAAGAAVAANPLAIRAAWFGTADAPSLLLVILSFALVTRSRYLAAGAALGGAILLKQFALVALPFVAAMIWSRTRDRRLLLRGGLVTAGIVAAGALPFLLADPGALWRDTIAYGATTYRIIGYGLSGLLVELDVVERTGSYPFVWIALVTWLPATLWLLRAQVRARAAWLGPAGFAASMFLLLAVSRVFQTSYLIWPLVGIAMAVVLRVSEGTASGGPETARSGSSPSPGDTGREPRPATSP